MKKDRLRYWLIACSSALGVVALLFLIVRSVDNIPDVEPNLQVKSILESNSCLMCHATDAKEPFYSFVPVVGDMVKEDMVLGVRAFLMDGIVERIAAGETLSEVEIAKLENAISKKSMPLLKFEVIHWNSHISNKERFAILKWCRDVRAKNFASPHVAAEFRNEPVQPLIESLPVNAKKVALGQKMYHDTRLSIDNTLSCASCHGLTTGGVDNKQFSEGVDGQFGGVNAPTVYNAALNFVQFWDGRAADLAEQAGGPPTNPVEMGAHSWEDICAKLGGDKALVEEFSSIYGEGEISQYKVTDVIAEFEKTLLTPNTRLDDYLKGNKEALTAAELNGYETFKAFNCATCHTGQILGGKSFEYMGAQENYFENRGNLTDGDLGRYAVTGNELDRHKFKTPTLRNVKLTYPYYHDGSVETLEEAVDKMVQYQTPYGEITEEDKSAIVTFLNVI